METIIHIIGFLLLWVATDIGRKPESKIKFFSGQWWLILVLITVGAILTAYDINPNYK